MADFLGHLRVPAGTEIMLRAYTPLKFTLKMQLPNLHLLRPPFTLSYLLFNLQTVPFSWVCSNLSQAYVVTVFLFKFLFNHYFNISFQKSGCRHGYSPRVSHN